MNDEYLDFPELHFVVNVHFHRYVLMRPNRDMSVEKTITYVVEITYLKSRHIQTVELAPYPILRRT